VESLLGLQRQGSRLLISPCIPRHWDTYSIDYRYSANHYHIVVVQTGAGKSDPTIRIYLDGIEQDDAGIALIDDHQDHSVDVHIDYAGTDTETDTPARHSN
jgi:cyclic beta-1,2-glucan synthetase